MRSKLNTPVSAVLSEVASSKSSEEEKKRQARDSSFVRPAQADGQAVAHRIPGQVGITKKAHYRSIPQDRHPALQISPILMLPKIRPKRILLRSAVDPQAEKSYGDPVYYKAPGSTHTLLLSEYKGHDILILRGGL